MVEPGFIAKGSYFDHDKSGIDGGFLRLHYLQCPRLVDWYVHDRFSISIGLSPAYMVSTRDKFGDTSSDAKPFYDRYFELSGLVGVQYDLTERFEEGARYNHEIMWTKEIEFSNEEGGTIPQRNTINIYRFISGMRCLIPRISIEIKFYSAISTRSPRTEEMVYYPEGILVCHSFRRRHMPRSSCM